jgi:hypothetical protein
MAQDLTSQMHRRTEDSQGEAEGGTTKAAIRRHQQSVTMSLRVQGRNQDTTAAAASGRAGARPPDDVGAGRGETTPTGRAARPPEPDGADLNQLSLRQANGVIHEAAA